MSENSSENKFKMRLKMKKSILEFTRKTPKIQFEIKVLKIQSMKIIKNRILELTQAQVMKKTLKIDLSQSFQLQKW